MVTFPAHLPDHRRRTVAGAASVLAAATVLAGAPGIAAVAGAAVSHATSSSSHRVLSTDVHITGDRSRRAELQYSTAHDRYRLISQYGKQQKVDFRSWQKDVLGSGERAVAQVVILPDEKTWSERKRSVAPLPVPSFGISSTGAQVARAIRDGVAHPDGLGVKDGQHVRLLTLRTGEHERSAMLWVNPSTLQPVAEASAYVTKGKSVRIVSSHWESVSSHTLRRLTAEPKVPAGYTVER